MKLYNVGILGATGAVGQEMMKILLERKFPVGELRPIASARSAGSEIDFGGRKCTIVEASDDAFEGLDIVLGAAENDIAERFAPAIVKAGAVFVDNSSAFRLDKDVPLVIPEINPEHFEVIPFQKKRLGQLLPGGQHGHCCSGKEGKRSHASPSAFRGAQSRHAVGGGEQPAGSGREVRDESQSQPRRHAGHGTLIIGSVGQQGAQQHLRVDQQVAWQKEEPHLGKDSRWSGLLKPASGPPLKTAAPPGPAGPPPAGTAG